MELAAGRHLAITLISDHGLDSAGWTFEFDRAQQRLGLCNFTTKLISMGADFVLAADVERVTQTMLHEIAHALVGKGKGHGYVWQARARSIGYTGDRTSTNPHHDIVRAAAHDTAKAVEADATAVTTGPIVVGERVVTANGTHAGLVVSVHRTRCTVMVDRTASEVIIPISFIRRANGGDRPTLPAQKTSTARRTPSGTLAAAWSRDQRVSIHLPGNRLHGEHAAIESVGPKNCIVVLDGGRRIRCAKGLLRAL